MLMNRKFRSLSTIFTLAIFGVGCGPGDEEEWKKSGSVSAVLKSSTFSNKSLSLNSGVELINVSGLADSLGLNFSETSGGVCGFSVWAAEGQTNRSGLEGRTYEAFNLGDPESWASRGAGMQGDCDSAVVGQVESYFVYLDLHLKIGNDHKTIRAYM